MPLFQPRALTNIAFSNPYESLSLLLSSKFIGSIWADVLPPSITTALGQRSQPHYYRKNHASFASTFPTHRSFFRIVVRHYGSVGAMHSLTDPLDDPEEIEAEKISSTFRKKFLRNHGIPYDSGFTVLRMPCVLGCFLEEKENLSQETSSFMNKVSGSVNRDLTINDTTGFFMCLNCRRQGSWRVLEDVISMLSSSGKPLGNSLEEANLLPGIKFSRPSPKQMEELDSLYTSAFFMNDLPDERFTKVLATHGLPSALSKSTFKRFGVKYDQARESLIFPLTNDKGDVTGIKFYSRGNGKSRHSSNSSDKETDEDEIDFTIMKCEQVFPRSANIPIGLFGLAQVSSEATEIVICSNVIDVLVLHQMTKPAQAVVALPKGICRLPHYELPQLERFKKLTIWFDNDVQSWQQAKLFAQKLGIKRCHFVRPKVDQPSPLKAVAHSLNIKRILSNSEPVKHEAITTFSNLRQDVYEELRQAEQIKGLKWKRFPKLTKVLSGHRRGELTVLTGPTGCGKTTFVSEYALDLAMQGTSTLWGSFEINNVRLLKTTLTQFAGVNLSKSLDCFDDFADEFEQLPISFLRFLGPAPLKKVLDVMIHACYVHDISHVVIDNLQFMMDYQLGSGSNFDRFHLQDTIISAFRHFATSKNCHVTLIVHPRKEDDPHSGLGISSIFGSAKATQEADNVIILQSQLNKKYLQIVKNRFSGEVGIVPLSFDKETLSFYHNRKNSQ